MGLGKTIEFLDRMGYETKKFEKGSMDGTWKEKKVDPGRDNVKQYDRI